MEYDVQCDVEVNDEELKLDIQLSPIEWAYGNVIIKHSPGSTEGPQLKFVLSRVCYVFTLY